jgi:hypothetical protein
VRFPRSTPWGLGMGSGGQQPHRPSVLGRVVGHAVLPDAPDHPDPGAGQDAHGVGVVAGALDRLGVDLGRPGEAWPESSAKSSSAARSFLSQAQRNLTTRRLPEVMVTGAAPPWAARASSVGKRARTSPSSASSAAARTPWPARGRLVKMCYVVGVDLQRSMISASSSRSWRLVTWMASSRASTQSARPAASAGLIPAAGAVCRRRSSSLAGVRPL